MASETVQDTLKKVDQAMVRLQEMQCTIVGGSKACGGVNLSPRSTRGYLRTSLRCKEESLRLKELAMKEVEETNPDKGQQFGRVSSLRRSSSIGEASRRWSMPAVLIQQAVGEIMEASNFAKEVAYLVFHSDQNELTESPNIPRISNGKTMTGMPQQQNSDFKHVPDAFETQDLDIGGTNGLQKFWSNKPDNKGHKFRVIAKDVSSSLKCLRDAEKQEHPERVRAELSELGMRARSKMSFQVFNRADRAEEQGRMDKLILSAPCYSPPAKAINEKTSSANSRVKIEQIRPADKGCLSRYNSTNAIMFLNPAFVSSPSKNTPRDRSTDACILRRKSMPSLNDLTSSKTTASSPFYKENELGDCMKDSSKNLKKSSSFSEAYRHTAAKLIKQSHIPSLLRKALKKFHVTKASPASVASGHSPIHNMKTEPVSNPRLAKSESLRIFPSSQMQGCLDRKNSMSSYDRSALKKFHVTKASPASVASGHSPIHNMKTEPGSNPRLAKSESLRIFPSSQMQGCLDRKNSMSSNDRSALKKFQVTRASPASVASGRSPIHNMKTEPGSNPRFAKSESVRIFPSSQVQGCVDRRKSMSSYDRSASSKISPLSKKPIESLVQPITPGWLPRKKSCSNLMHSQPDTMGEEVANKIIMTEETEVGEGQVNYMHYERGQIEASLPFENFVSKQGVSPVEDYSLRSSIQTIANSSANNTLYPSDVQEYDNYLGCSEQGFLRPVDTNCGLHRVVRSESNMDASKEKLNKKKSASQRKENRDVNREDAAGEVNQITKNSSKFLGRSWSFRHEKLNNSTVWQPFFKNAKDWMKSQSPSSVNR